jgi:hypothetical protein
VSRVTLVNISETVDVVECLANISQPPLNMAYLESRDISSVPTTNHQIPLSARQSYYSNDRSVT